MCRSPAVRGLAAAAKEAAATRVRVWSAATSTPRRVGVLNRDQLRDGVVARTGRVPEARPGRRDAVAGLAPVYVDIDRIPPRSSRRRRRRCLPTSSTGEARGLREKIIDAAQEVDTARSASSSSRSGTRIAPCEISSPEDRHDRQNIPVRRFVRFALGRRCDRARLRAGRGSGDGRQPDGFYRPDRCSSCPAALLGERNTDVDPKFCAFHRPGVAEVPRHGRAGGSRGCGNIFRGLAAAARGIDRATTSACWRP